MPDAKPFNIMAKPIGPRCNIDCKYCYYLEKESQFPKEKKFRMHRHVLERYIEAKFEAAAKVNMQQVNFAWQGGEPTILGVPYFKDIVALQKQLAPGGMTFTNAIQTNGMLLDDNWGAFLSENRFLVGISIDGPQKIHDRYRVGQENRPTFRAVMKGIEILQLYQVSHNALTVVNRYNATKGQEVYTFLKGAGFNHIQFIPIVERTRGGDQLAGAPRSETGTDLEITDWSARPKSYGKFLCDIFDIWYRKDVGKISVQHFDVMLGKWMGEKYGLCVFAETCGDSLALEHNGNLYACDHYVYPEYLLGNILNTPLVEMVYSDRQAKFGRDKRDYLTNQCKSCPFKFACNGGCPKHRFATSALGEPGHNYFCESYTMFFKHAKDRLALLARSYSRAMNLHKSS